MISIRCYQGAAITSSTVDSGFLQALYENAPSCVKVVLQRVCTTLRSIAVRRASQYVDLEGAICHGCVADVTIFLRRKRLSRVVRQFMMIKGCSPCTVLAFGSTYDRPGNMRALPYLYLTTRGEVWFEKMIETRKFPKINSWLLIARGSVTELYREMMGMNRYYSMLIWLANGHNIDHLHTIIAHEAAAILCSGVLIPNNYFAKLITHQRSYVNALSRHIHVDIEFAQILARVQIDGLAPYAAKRHVVADKQVWEIIKTSAFSRLFCGVEAENCTLAELIDKVEATGSLEVAYECAANYKVDIFCTSAINRIKNAELVTWVKDYVYLRGQGTQFYDVGGDYYCWRTE